MSKPSILPFKDWFRVYESAGCNYEKSQRILESRMHKGLSRIFEASVPQTNVSIPEGLADGYKIGNGLWGSIGDFGDNLEISNTDNFLQYETAMKLTNKIPDVSFLIDGKFKKVGNDTITKLNIFKLVLAGIGNSVSSENYANSIIKDENVLKELSLKVEFSQTFNLPGANGIIYSVEKLKPDAKLESVEKWDQGISKIIDFCGYLNTFNLTNWALGSFLQYSNLYDSIMEPGGSLNKRFQFNRLGGDEDAAKKESDVLYLYSISKEGQPSKEEGQGTPAADAPIIKKGAWISWKNLDYDYDEEGDVVSDGHPDYIEFAKNIIRELGPNDVITKLQLTSTIGPTWQGIQTSGNGTGEPVKQDGTKLTDDTFKAEKTDIGNKWLAWRRGRSIEYNIYNSLGPRIQKGAVEILWNIKKQSPVSEFNLSYNIISKNTAPSPIKDNQYVTDKLLNKSNDQGGGISIHQYIIEFDNSAVGKNVDSKLKKATGGLIGKTTASYDRLIKGDKIVYKGKDDNGNISDKIRKTGTVISKDKDGTVIETESGNKITIKRERFISGQKITKSDKGTEF